MIGTRITPTPRMRDPQDAKDRAKPHVLTARQLDMLVELFGSAKTHGVYGPVISVETLVGACWSKIHGLQSAEVFGNGEKHVVELIRKIKK